MGQDSNALRYAEAERIFRAQRRGRVKVGKAVQTLGKTRGNGFLQGRCYNIEFALMTMSVWTRAVEKEAEVQTTGIVDDSAVRSKRGKTRRQAVDELRKARCVQGIRSKDRNKMQQQKRVNMIVSDEKQKNLWKESLSRRSSSAPRPLCWLEAR